MPRCVLIRSWTLRHQFVEYTVAYKVCSQTPSRESLGDGLFCLLRLAVPWGDRQDKSCAPVKNRFFICYSLVGLRNSSPLDFQN